MRVCRICNKEKDINHFPKWKKTCKKCLSEYNKEWRRLNKSLKISECIDCGVTYETVIYSTGVANNRCRKCSINNKKIIPDVKVCNICEVEKSVDNFYKNYRICKPCLFAKRNVRYNNRLKSDITFRIKHNIKVNIKRHISMIGEKKRNKTVDILGCSISELRLYLESKFETWMSWDNYGLYNGKPNHGWDIDHIIPISSATSMEDVIKLNHYTNFQPLCSYINRNIKKDNLNYES